jgi:hypothetical protein
MSALPAKAESSGDENWKTVVGDVLVVQAKSLRVWASLAVLVRLNQTARQLRVDIEIHYVRIVVRLT